jgi:hypothetical protein
MTIRNNRLDTIGYIGIISDGTALIEKNVVRHPLATMNDGGGIAIDHADGIIIQRQYREPHRLIHNGAPGRTAQWHGHRYLLREHLIKNTIARRNTVYNCPKKHPWTIR